MGYALRVPFRRHHNLHSRLAPHVAAWGTSKQNWPCQVRTISITGEGRRYAPVRFPGRHGRVVPNDRGGYTIVKSPAYALGYAYWSILGTDRRECPFVALVVLTARAESGSMSAKKSRSAGDSTGLTLSPRLV
jgi:hypothetical protein